MKRIILIQIMCFIMGYSWMIQLMPFGNKQLSRALLKAAQEDNLSELQRCIENHVRINTCNESGETALHFAQNEQMVHELILAGIDINKADYNGETPLHRSLHDNNLHKAMILLYSGAKANTMVCGETPLLWAVIHDEYYLVCELIKNGAKVTREIVKKAYSLKFLKIAKLLDYYRNIKGKKSPVRIIDKFGYTAMHRAVLKNDLIAVDVLSLIGMSVNGRDYRGRTPIHLAVDRGYEEMMHKLFALNAKINVVDCEGLTPFHYAMRNNFLSLGVILQKNGAFVSVLDHYGKRAIEYYESGLGVKKILLANLLRSRSCTRSSS